MIEERASTERTSLTYEAIVDDLLILLGRAGALPEPVEPTPWEAFVRLSELIHERFVVPWTTFTPVMRRLVFALGLAARARHVVGVGTYVAYTYAWLLRDGADERCVPHLESAIGFDVDAEANALARRNCACLGHGERVSFIDADGCVGVARGKEPIDLLYIDLDAPDAGKRAYRTVLEAALPRLREGALILAHDSCVEKFRCDIEQYHDLVRRSVMLSGPWNLPIDSCGLSVAVRRRVNPID
jgi:predicted O-methyltransferase YrrM